jgi:hypothetical protein
MGMLLHHETGERIVLRGNHVFGRNASRSDTLLTNRESSLLHAVIRWRDAAWTLTDCSSNGTSIDGRKLPSGTAVPLSVGQSLHFGTVSFGGWQVIDLSPPSSVLVPLDPRLEPIPLAPHNLLPDTAAPEASLYEQQRGCWVLESEDELRFVRDGDRLEIARTPYRLVLIDPVDDTYSTAGVLSSVVLIFRLSLNEEHTHLHVRCGSQAVDLGERTHHYALVTLARKRLADARTGMDPSALGWFESPRLAQMLGIEPVHLNIQLFRARDQLMKALSMPGPLSSVIERRRGELRMGPVDFEIYRGSKFEGRLSSNMAETA